jgi:hypothetical protein
LTEDKNIPPKREAGRSLQKGNCLDCKFYNRCPRMRGIDRCYNMHWVQKDPLQEPEPEKKERP